MPEDSDLDLESCWRDVRGLSLIEVNSGKASDLEGALSLTAEKGIFDLRAKFRSHEGEPITSELLSEVITLGIKTFMRHWYQTLRNQDLAGLIEIILEGQGLSPSDMLGFVRALPRALLERILKSSTSTTTGIHALLAIELAFRDGDLPHGYVMDKDLNRTYVEFRHNQLELVRFYLDESIEVRPLPTGDSA